jgi:hypothetical protein
MLVLRNIIAVPNVENFDDNHECRYPDFQFRWLLSDGTKRETVGQQCSDTLTQINREASEYFASCWYDSDDGSPNETMWNAYADDGVFVVFDKKQLMEAILRKSYTTYKRVDRQHVKPFGYGPVEYYGHVDFGDWLAGGEKLPHPAFAKRRAYRPENEFRIVYRRRDFPHDPQKGLFQPSRGIGLHFDDNIESFGLARIVYKSEMTKQALWAIRDHLKNNCNRSVPTEMYSEDASKAGIGEEEAIYY